MSNKKFYFLLSLLTVGILSTSFILFLRLHRGNDNQIVQDVNKEEQREVSVIEEPIEDKDQQDLLIQGLSLALGKDNSLNYEKAMRIFLDDSISEIPDVAFILGEMYMQGIGTEADERLASEYIEKAFLGGCKEAFALYGKMSFLGYGMIRQDYEQSAKAFFAIATEDADAACALGVMYTFGMGIPYDYTKAQEYFDIAISLGSAEAYGFKTKLENLPLEERDVYQIDCSNVTLTKTNYENEQIDKDIHALMTQLSESEEDTDFMEKILSLSNLDVTTVTTHIVFGKDNWLIWQNPFDGTAYHDYICDISFSEEELSAIANRLEQMKTKIEANGSKFVLMLLPNKENVYSEQMPSFIQKVGTIDRLTQLTEYLINNTDIDVISMKDAYLREKDDNLLYYTTDTHFNMKGSFVAVAELLNKEYGKHISIDQIVFHEPMNNYSGDVAMFIGMEEQYAQDIVYLQKEEDVPVEDTVNDSITFIGDSFSEFLSRQCAYYFKGGMNHIMIMDYDYDFYKATEPIFSEPGTNIVVWECVERYLDRLK